ncbi:MAG TPA: sigma factor-like helix-turn-helix DNA-binding protein, partial [Bryobacteraceae bacterium]|nr:sigma factor-like helix-turn-helix DNA-binding protein [Bryobacteraceae bacterium]
RRSGYPGTWLPSPVSSEPAVEEPADSSGNPAARYDMVESLSFAFLLALEALSPTQRAVLLLRDVFDYSAREVAAALGMTEANARTTHMRARRAMAAYDKARQPITPEWRERTRAALDRFLFCVRSGDVAKLESLLAANITTMSDAGGEFFTHAGPITGRDRVAQLFLRIAQGSTPITRMDSLIVNGMPAVLVAREPRPGYAPRFVIQAELDADGRLVHV